MPIDDSAAAVSSSQLHERFSGPLRSFFARRVRDQTIVQDLTQETLLRVIAAQKQSQVARPESYVFTVATNLLRDRQRSFRRESGRTFVPIETVVADELEKELVEDLSPERVLLSKDTLYDVLRTLDELGERTRDIFVLFRLEGMKQKDIAALYDIGQSTVEKHVMRAVLHLSSRYAGGRTP